MRSSRWSTSLAALVALVALSVAARPADEDHAYGHTKAEYFSSGFEGALILLAAASIIIAARSAPARIRSRSSDPGLGLAIIGGRDAHQPRRGARAVPARAAGTSRSRWRPTRHHLMSRRLDLGRRHRRAWEPRRSPAGTGSTPSSRSSVALNILCSGRARCSGGRMLGLLDTALPEDTRRKITAILDAHANDGVRYHALRTRQAGARRFISFHILVPGELDGAAGHDLLERNRGGGARRRAQQQRGHPPGADRGPGVVERPAAGTSGLERGEGAHRPGAEAGDLGRHRGEAEAGVGQWPEIAEVLDDRNPRAEQRRMHRRAMSSMSSMLSESIPTSPAPPSARHAAAAAVRNGLPDRYRGRAPMPAPAGPYQHRLPPNIPSLERLDPDPCASPLPSTTTASRSASDSSGSAARSFPSA